MYDRDALLAAVDLRALADDLLGPHVGTDRTPMWHCPNPQHAQTGRTPPLSVFTGHRGDQRWRCHGCGEGGTAIDLVLVTKQCGLRDALDYLAGRVGYRDHDLDWTPPPARIPTAPVREVGCADPDGLQRYVDECARRLWKPEGHAIRHWLTHVRGLPADILERNSVGADLGSRNQTRPDGMPRAHGAVLPVTHTGEAIYAQIRIPHPNPGRPKYLNPRSDLATNPRLARMRPVHCEHPEVIVTEGTIDALTAATAGYRAVALLSATYGDEATAAALASLPHPLVLALDPDDAGRAGSDRLATLLEARRRPPVRLELIDGDLNDTMRRSNDWRVDLRAAVDRALGSREYGRVLGR